MIHNVQCKYIPYTVRRALHNIRRTVYNVRCTVFTFTPYTVICTIHIVEFTIYCILWTMYAAHCTMIGVRCTVYYDTMQYISYKVRCSHLFRTLLCVKYTRTLYVVQCTSYKVPSYGLQSTVFTFIPYTVSVQYTRIMYVVQSTELWRTMYGVHIYSVCC